MSSFILVTQSLVLVTKINVQFKIAALVGSGKLKYHKNVIVPTLVSGFASTGFVFCQFFKPTHQFMSCFLVPK